MNDELEDIIKNPPKGAWAKMNSSKIAIGATTRSLRGALFFVPFTFICIVLLYRQFYEPQIINREFNMNLTGVLFSIMAIFLIFGSLMKVFGKNELVLGKDSYTFYGFGCIGIKKKFKKENVTAIYEYHKDDEDVRYKYIHIGGDDISIKFGLELTKERREYILKALLAIFNDSENYFGRQTE